MGKKSLGIIHAAVFTANTIQPYCDSYIPDVEIIHCGDDSVQRDNLAAPVGTIPKHNFLKFANFADGLQRAGCDAILLACSTFNQAAEFARPMIDIPIFNIDGPMMEKAVSMGSKIGLLGTLPSTMPASERLLRQSAEKIGKEIEVISRLNDKAFQLVRSGDVKGHNDLLVQDILEMEKQGAEVVVLAQISMAVLKERQNEVNIPILNSGDTSFAFLKEWFANNDMN